jgi:transcriptional regulator with XRE-family HTH domain
MLARLREARLQLGLSQAEVGRRLKRTNQFVSKVETGERRLDPIDLWQLAGVYKRPVGDFLPSYPFTQPSRHLSDGDDSLSGRKADL